MNIISLIQLTCKYKLKGLFNDLRKYLINMIKLYGLGLIIILGILSTVIFFFQTSIFIEDINLYFNYIFPLFTTAIIVGYMYSPLVLIIFSKPDIFYLIRNKILFNKIAWIKLIKTNVAMVLMVIGFSYIISYNIESANFINVLACLLFIPSVANLKYYIFNKNNSNRWKISVVVFFSIQLLFPNIYLIVLEYFVSIVAVSLIFNNLNLEKLTPIYSYQYDADRMIKTGGTTKVNVSEISPTKSKIVIEDISEVNNNIFFKCKKNLSFFIKDYKSMKNRPKAMNIMFIALVIGVGILNILFQKYRFILYVMLYLILNSQLKSIFNNNYYILFNKVSLCSSIKTFIKETSYFSISIYILINTILFIPIGNPYYTIPFIFLISISSALTSNYNGLKNLNVSIFNLFNIVLTAIYLTINNHIISIVLIGMYSIILYKILYKSIKLRVNI